MSVLVVDAPCLRLDKGFVRLGDGDEFLRYGVIARVFVWVVLLAEFSVGFLDLSV